MPKVWNITKKLKNMHCIVHPHSDWLYIPVIDNYGNPIPVDAGESRLLCATCVIPNYDNENKRDLPEFSEDL